MLNLSIDTDARVRPHATRAPCLGRRSFLRYLSSRVSILMSVPTLALRNLGVSLFAVLAAGCASVAPNYVPPERAGNSVVTVNLAKGGVVYYANGDDCTDAKILAPEHNPTLRADRSLVVPANKRIALQSLWVSGLTTCHVITSMKLRPDTQYVLAGVLEKDQCKVTFVDASNLGRSITDEIDLKQMAWGWNTCHPLANK
jgi:hypothetical protein